MKKNKLIPKCQIGTLLPIAPKVLDRYKNGRVTWNSPEFKEVSSSSGILGDPFASKISMEVNGNDTTFVETPGRWLPVKLKQRVAKKEVHNLRPISYYTSKPLTKTIVINPEYEILKRRFNLAWNLVNLKNEKNNN